MPTVAAEEYITTTEIRDGETVYAIGQRVPASVCARWNNFGTMLMVGHLVPAPPEAKAAKKAEGRA